jgi:DNA repair exonuclease SbcCD ATPase subunit
MFRIKTQTVKNFMSIGNGTQALDFDRQDLTLVLGKNVDLGGHEGEGHRNGTGKTTIANALSYALYGQALTNIRKENLINKTNEKNMLVTLEFEFDSKNYRIERGRKPNVLKFYVNDVEHNSSDDNSQGDSRETQQAIERTLGMSHDMFKHIVALNTYTEPFLAMRANDQRCMIEQLLGITQLSEKADRLKEQIRNTRDLIQQEEHRIRAVNEANQRIQEQIVSLRRRQSLWLAKRDQDLRDLTGALVELEQLDIEAELEAHRCLDAYEQERNRQQVIASDLKRLELELTRERKAQAKITGELNSLEQSLCYACGQVFHGDDHDGVVLAKKQALADSMATATGIEAQISELGTQVRTLTPCPPVFYDAIEDAYQHMGRVASLREQIQAKQQDQDPYAEQIEDMIQRALENISYDVLNELVRLQEHQDFVLKLLTSKDSFIRKTIIEQNLGYLNQRLSYYLDQLGLPHTVAFLNDLTVEIQELGRELDFDNLSRGERNRLILSLSLAFRDVWEGLYQPINLLFIDEVVDSGMDSSGVEAALALLKRISRDSNKSVWLVSHKDELSGRVNNILNVIKEGGYTTYSNDVDVV